MHKIELYLDDDEYERLSVLQRYLYVRSVPGCKSSVAPFDAIFKFGVFDDLFDLSCLKDIEKIAEMKEYLSRTEGK